MASRPYFEVRCNPRTGNYRGVWKIKYKPDPTGKWEAVILCKHPSDWSPARPPKRPPMEAIDRAREFAEIEYRAKHGIGAAPKRARSLATFLDSYVKSQSLSARSGSAEQLARHVKSFKEFAERQGITSLQAVTRAHCRSYLEARLEVVSHATLRTERGYLIGAWTRAVDDELLTVNPWTRLPVPGKPAEPEITFWSSDDITAIAGACTKTWQKDFVLILANTGLRISTALAMEWSWIDWRQGTIKIPAGVEDVKTAYTLSIYRVARDVLQRRFDASKGSALVFPNPLGDGGVIGYETARAAIERSIKRAGVKHGTCHDLRHSCARNMILFGASVTVVQRQLGHTTLAMTQRYVSADAETSARYEDFGIGDG